MSPPLRINFSFDKVNREIPGCIAKHCHELGVRQVIIAHCSSRQIYQYFLVVVVPPLCISIYSGICN